MPVLVCVSGAALDRQECLSYQSAHTCLQTIRCASTLVVIRDFWRGVVDLYPGVRF